MGTDIYSQAGSAILSFVNGEGTFEVKGSKFTVRVPGGMDEGKKGELGNIIGQLKPRKFRIGYREDGIEIEALDPSLQTLEDLLTKLTRRLNE
jgi:hypothetical protein